MNICDLNIFEITDENDSELVETLMRDAFDICDHYARRLQKTLGKGMYIEIYDDETLKSWYYLNTGDVVTTLKDVFLLTQTK